jgi:hypothetical protein
MSHHFFLLCKNRINEQEKLIRDLNAKYRDQISKLDKLQVKLRPSRSLSPSFFHPPLFFFLLLVGRRRITTMH